MEWFRVDKAGLGQLLERRAKSFVGLELLQNSWDQNATEVNIEIARVPSSPYVTIAVTDNDPQGFTNLAHAFTLFAPSEKKAHPERRGRFNLGEKLVLALCDEARICTTTGTVRFDRTGRRQLRERRAAGSCFWGRLRMTSDEVAACLQTLKRVLPPPNVVTTINGERLASPTPLTTLSTSLPTEIADDEGRLVRRQRVTKVRVFEPEHGESGWLFELGIPVVETGDAYHVDVDQKVPVSLDRDNVPASYLRTLRTAVLNHTFEDLDQPDQASAAWVREALADPRCSDAAVQHAIHTRFGPRAVAYDPSDLEANKRAVSQGYAVVHGGSLSKLEWENVRRTGVLAPAGRVTPTPKPFSDDPDAPALKTVPESDWSDAEKTRIAGIRQVGKLLLGTPVSVTLAADREWPFSACFGGGRMTLNRAKLGRAWFDGPLTEDSLALVLHELGHHYESDHLSDGYHDALCRLGARLALTPSWQGQQ